MASKEIIDCHKTPLIRLDFILASAHFQELHDLARSLLPEKDLSRELVMKAQKLRVLSMRVCLKVGVYLQPVYCRYTH